jgi:FkbM family methyltransferase
LNKEYCFVANKCALGEKDFTDKIAITNLRNIGWNTIVPGFMDFATVKETRDVVIRRLDSYIQEKGLNNIALIKIDTEGYEFPVLKGLSNYFETNRCRPAIICEIVPDAYALLGYQLVELSRYMDKFKYKAFELSNTNKRIDISQLRTTTNTR